VKLKEKMWEDTAYYIISPLS